MAIRGEVAKSIGSEGQVEYCDGGAGGGEVGVESGGLGLPRMADNIEYSRLAASDPNAKDDGSKAVARRDSVWGTGFASERR